MTPIYCNQRGHSCRRSLLPTRLWVVASTVALLLACQNGDKAAELAAKEQQLAAKEQQLKEDALAAREQAIAAREQLAARPAATPTPSAAPGTWATPAAAPVQPARTAGAAAAPEEPTPPPIAPQAAAPYQAAAPHAVPEAPTPPPVAPPAVTPHAVFLTVNVTVDMTKPSGQQWDGLGDAPDPFITATVARSGQTAASVTKNSLNATASLKLDLQVGDTVSINVVDKDLSAHDPIGSFAATYFGGGPGVLQGRLGAGSITVTFGG